MKKTVIGITVVGKDKEGIVAAFTNFVFENGGNIEKVNQNVIKGLFGMYLEASFTKSVDVKKFDSGIQKKSLKGCISVIIGTEKTLEPLARKAKIPFILIGDANQEKAEEKILEVCKKHEIDLIVLARYMKILSPNFVWRYPNRIINIHPSLLPAFPGALAYAQAYERGTKIVGVTSHYVTENLDQGPIIFQDSFEVDPNDTLEEIKAKGQKLEADTLLKATKMHLENKLEVRWRKVHIKSK
jgi:formyltetrahydrofolate deformylase